MTPDDLAPAPPAVDPEDLAWLRKVHLFADLPDAALEAFLRHASKVAAQPGAWLIEYADANPPFVLLQRGRAEAFTRHGDTAILLGILEAQDYAGVEALLRHRRSLISVRALRPTVYFRLEAAAFFDLLGTYPRLARRVALVAQSRQWARERRPTWLPRSEWVQIFTRRHPIVLWARLLGVALTAAVLITTLALVAWASTYAGLWGIVAFVVLGSLLAALWIYLEWSNDYYIITTRRAARVDRLFPIQDSRHEVPLTMINAAEVQTGFWGRRFGFGDVTARTWAEPPLVFTTAPQPDDIGGVLDELIRRVREAEEHAERGALQERLRARLGLPVPEEPEVEPLAEPLAEPEPAPAGPLDALRLLRESLFSSRIEQGDTITYRKHWIFLLQRTITPLSLVVGLWAVALWYWLKGFSWPSPPAMMLLVFLTTLGAFLGVLYQTWDWANDIYQITTTQVLDIKAVPLGEVQRKAAPLEKVVSVDFERPSLWARVFNFGNVTIQTGPEEPLVFYRVWHPDQVQQDLFLRMEALRQRKQREEWLRQQERFLDWLAAYHDLAQEVFSGPQVGSEAEAAAPLPPLEPEAPPAEPESPEPSWEEALGFDYDPWVTPPGIPPPEEDAEADEQD